MNKFTCVIDPGHGGDDPGAVYGSLYEKDVNLKVALALRARILTDSSQNTIIPILTRETDIFLSLGKRCRISNDQGARFFLCIHCNADPDEDLPGMSEAKGEEVWYCAGSSKGKLYAETISKTIDRIFPDEPFRGIKQTHTLYVLNHTLAPANLIELGFIDNSNTNRKFRNPIVVNEIANCLYQGILLIQKLIP